MFIFCNLFPSSNLIAIAVVEDVNFTSVRAKSVFAQILFLFLFSIKF